MPVELNHRIDGSGPHVLLLHAVGMDLTLLDALTAIMAKDFTVLRADLRGHGQSPYVPAASLADYADDVHALLTKLSFGPCAVAGFAMGGMVTQALAVKYPQDTRALMIASCAHAQTPESRAALLSRAAGAQARRYREDPRRDDAALVQRRLHRARRRRGGAPAAARRQCRRLGGRLRRDGDDRYRAAIEEIKVPTLCLVGEVDKSTPPPVVKAIADAIPGARFAVLPGGPHMPFVEVPAEVAKVVGGFFKEVLK